MIDSTRFPAGRLRSASIFKPATWGKRPLGAGSCERPFSIAALRALPRTSMVTRRLSNGNSARTSRRVIVELDRGRSDRRVEFLVKLVLELCDDCRDFGVGRRHRGVDNAELRPPPYATPSALF